MLYHMKMPGPHATTLTPSHIHTITLWPDNKLQQMRKTEQAKKKKKFVEKKIHKT